MIGRRGEKVKEYLGIFVAQNLGTSFFWELTFGKLGNIRRRGHFPEI